MLRTSCSFSSPFKPSTFGWAPHGHTAIHQSIAQNPWLPDKGLRQLFALNRDNIDSISSQLDYHNAPKHIVDDFLYQRHGLNTELYFDESLKHQYEYTAEERASYVLNGVKHHTLTADKYLKPENFYRFEDSPNLLSNLLDLHKKLTQKFEALNKLEQDKNATKNEAFYQAFMDNRRREIYRYMAEVAHFAADLCQPFHVTAFSPWDSWILPYEQEVDLTHKGAHWFSEDLMLNKADSYLRWLEADTSAANRREPLKKPLAKSDLKKTLMRTARNSYRKFVACVEADYTVRKELGLLDDSGDSVQLKPLMVSGTVHDRYEKALLKLWESILSPQHTQATELASRLIYSAYLNAGKPDLKPLLAETVAQKTEDPIMQVWPLRTASFLLAPTLKNPFFREFNSAQAPQNTLNSN